MSGDDEVISKFAELGLMDKNDVISKEYCWITDLNSSSYNSEVKFDMSTLGRTEQFLDYSQGFVIIPYVISARSTIDIDAFINEQTISMKDGFYQIIDSVSVEFQQKVMNQVQAFNNIHTHFKMLTSSSQEDIEKNGAITGFYGDDGSSMTYNATASTQGVGYCNAHIGTNGVPANTASFRRKKETTAFNMATAMIPSINKDVAINNGRSYFSKTDGVGNSRIYYLVVNCIVRLRDVSDLFSKIPITKCTDIKLRLTYNSSRLTLNSTTGGNYSMTNYQQVSGNCCPFNIAPFATGGAEQTLTVSSGVSRSGLGENAILGLTSCRLYVPVYKLSNSLSLSLISNYPETKFSFTDIYSFSIPNIMPNQSFVQNLSTGILSPMYVVVIPIPKTNNLAGLNCSDYQSPFSSCPGTFSGVILKEFQIQVSGVNLFQSNQKYDYEQYIDQLSEINAINGNHQTGLTSGLISYYDFQQYHRVYCCQTSRRNQSDEKVSKSIIISGINSMVQNVALGVTGEITLICFVAYKKELNISTATGIVND